MRPIEAVPAVTMFALAVLIYVGTTGLNLWDGITPGARFFPVILAVIGGALALALLAAQVAGIEKVTPDFPTRGGGLRVVATVLCLVALALGVPLVGFVPALALFVLAVLMVILRQKPVPSLLTAAFVAGAVHFVFAEWLSVPLPMPFGI